MTHGGRGSRLRYGIRKRWARKRGRGVRWKMVTGLSSADDDDDDDGDGDCGIQSADHYSGYCAIS